MRFIWTKKALALWAQGKTDPRHTISAPNIADCYLGFVRQMRDGCPWALVNDTQVIAIGEGKFEL